MKAALVCRRVTGVSGATTIVLEQARRLAAEGWSVEVVGQVLDADRIRRAGARPRRLLVWPWPRRRRRERFAAAVERLVSGSSHDLVHGHGDDGSSRVHSLHNCVHAAHEAVHGKPLPPDNAVGRLHEGILRRARFDLLIANSRLMADDVRSRFGVPEEKIRIVLPGHDPARFNPEGRALFRERFRRDVGAGPEDRVVGLITSGDFEKRGVRRFLQALARLSPEVRRRLIVVLAGKEARWGDYASDARATGLGERLKVSPPVEDVERLFHGLDLYVHPALFEEFGLSVEEALACGVPVLTTPRVGALDLLPASARGEVMVKGTAESLSAAMDRLLRDDGARTALGALGPPAVRENTWDHYCSRIRRLYEELRIG